MTGLLTSHWYINSGAGQHAQWTQANTGLTNSYVNVFAVSGADLFVGTNSNDSSVFLSGNNGTSWTATDSGLTTTFVYALAVSDTNLFPGVENFPRFPGLGRVPTGESSPNWLLTVGIATRRA